jgi:hypothetical protein
MAIQTTEPQVQPATPDLEARFPGRYLSVTSAATGNVCRVWRAKTEHGEDAGVDV